MKIEKRNTVSWFTAERSCHFDMLEGKKSVVQKRTTHNKKGFIQFEGFMKRSPLGAWLAGGADEAGVDDEPLADDDRID